MSFNIFGARTLQPKTGGATLFYVFDAAPPLFLKEESSTYYSIKLLLLLNLKRWERSSNFCKNDVGSNVFLI